VNDCEVLIFRSGVNITAQLMNCAPRLSLLIRAGAGLDNLDVDYVRRRGLSLIRVPGPGARAVAEMSYAFMLALSRNLMEADRLTRHGRWAKHELAGHLLKGKTLGIVGLGNTGTEVARLGLAWDMQVIGCVEHPTSERAERFREIGIQLATLEETMARGDYVSIHVPLQESTRHLIDARSLARMKTGAYLLNLARGGVVDEDALRTALTQPGGLQGAALDVHAEEGEGRISPLAGLPNVILTPHIGAMALDSQREIGNRILDIIRRYCAGKREL
jgi:phosphoglycerate dehydrogenase-like enzyme